MNVMHAITLAEGAAAEDRSNYVLVAIVVLGLMLVIRSFRRARSTSERPARIFAKREPAAKPSRLDAPDEYRQWEVELHELGREITARIDNKISVLEYLIETAQVERAKLEATIAAARHAADERRD